MNLKRIELVAKSTFALNKKSYLQVFFASIGMISILAILDIIATIQDSSILAFDTSSVGFVLSLIISAFIPFQMYRKYKNRLYVSTLHMLPASTNEKFFVPFFISLILVPAVIIILYSILTSLFWLLSVVINVNVMSYVYTIQDALIFFTPKTDSEALMILLTFLTLLHSAACLNNRLSGAVVLFVFCFPTILNLINNDFLIFDYYYIIMLIITLIFWIIAYLKFKKAQING